MKTGVRVQSGSDLSPKLGVIHKQTFYDNKV